MKVLHILDHSIPLHSGYTFRTRNILRQQRALGWQTDHVTSTKHTAQCPAEEEIDGLHFFRTPESKAFYASLPLLNQWAVVTSLAERLREIVPQVKPDILHAHSPSLNGLAALKVARKMGLPLVYECRAFWEDAAVDHGTSAEGGLRYRLTRAMETHLFRQADAVTTICEGLRQDIISRGIDASKITVIPNAVDLAHFPPSAGPDVVLKQRLGLNDKTVLGFIGSFYGYEGLVDLVRALPLIQQKNVALLLVGGGPQEQKIKQTVADLGLQDQVVFTGRVPHDQVQDYYDLIDILVYPRLSMRLTELVTPLKPLEAMAQDKLVLASDVGGHKELIRHGDNGWLFQANNIDALAKTVDEALAHKDDWPKIKASGRRYVEQERNWETSVARYVPLYESLVRSR